MLSFSLRLFIVSLVVLALALQAFHVMCAPGGVMIVDVCSKSPDPNRCQTCLNGDPKGKFADIRGLAMISIACGENNAYALYQKLNEAIYVTNNNALKVVLGKTYDSLGSAAFLIGQAGPLLQKKGVAAAKQSVMVNATAKLLHCSQLLNSATVPVPKTFINELNALGKDCMTIDGILNRIVR